MAKLDESTLVQMGREYPDIAPLGVVERLKDVRRHAQRHATACVRYCNEADFDPKRIEGIEVQLAARIGVLFPGTVAVFQRDPRGATVKLLPPSGATNDWGREGLCVLA